MVIGDDDCDRDDGDWVTGIVVIGDDDCDRGDGNWVTGIVVLVF